MAQTMTFHGDRQFLAFLAGLSVSADEEFVRVAPKLDNWSSPDVRKMARDMMRRCGPHSRKLFGPAACKSERGRRHLREIAVQGAAVRIAAIPLPRATIIIDRRIAILAGPDTRAGREYTVTTESSVIGAVCGLFEAAWQTAVDIAAFPGPDQLQLDIVGRMILRALGSGATDEVAAEKLGLSVRTYRRRVADLLEMLGAGSRFQAGLRAGELGLADNHDVDSLT